ncbi:hypothetical protein Tco_1224017 [Tanacetum coccineum]
MENMDGYRDQDMGDIILREPFCKASCVEEKMFDGLITIRNGSDNVTYQMARSRLRFKHLSNAQCNKIKPLLKVSLHDKLNGISHPYQKLKSFYKGVLNLGPEYVRDAKMEEWLTRGHISVHEIEKLVAKKIDEVGEGRYSRDLMRGSSGGDVYPCQAYDRILVTTEKLSKLVIYQVNAYGKDPRDTFHKLLKLNLRNTSDSSEGIFDDHAS